MKDSSPATLRKTNLIFVAAAAGLMCLATILVVWLLKQSYERYHEAAAENALNTAISLERFLGAHFQASELALHSAVTEYRDLHESGQFNAQQFSTYLQGLRQRLPNALSVRGADSKGNIIYGESVNPKRPSYIGDREYFQRVRDSMQLTFSLPVTSRVTGERLFTTSLPLINAEGAFSGIVYVNTATPRIEELFASIKLGERGIISLFDAERRIVIRYPRLPNTGDEQVMHVSSPGTLAALDAGKTEAVYRSRSPYDGQMRSLAYRKISHYPMYVIVGLAETDYLAPWWRECQLGLAFLALLGIGSLTLGFSVRRYVSARFQVVSLEEQQASHDHLTAIIRAIPDLLFELDIEGHYLDCRATNAELLAMPPEAFIGRKVSEILPKEAAQTMMAAIAEANETGYAYGAQIHIKVPAGELWFELSIARKQDHRTDQSTFIVLSRDITERNHAQAQIEQLAFSDMLTGLPNRRLFLDRLRQSMAVSDRNATYQALLFLDIDKFKTLNDTLGHQIGDLLLMEIADRLRRVVREYDTVARLGGDEFVVLLEQLGPSEADAAAQAQHVAEKVAEQLSREYDLSGHKYLGTCSIGIALFSGQSLSSDELLRRADLAMYQAKSNGHRSVCFFDPEMQASIASRLELELDLKQAIIHEEFSLYYQPQFNTDSQLIGAEALIRWKSPRRGFVSPAEFIPLAEETSLILPIGHWVMREACRCLESWNSHPVLSQVAISVNVSAKQIGLPTFVEEVEELLSFYDVDPTRLKLEVTETMLVDRIDEIISRINSLRAIGVRFSLDDFGTGYSSLSYLKRLPFNQVKIDQSFARAALDDPNDAAICRAIIALGNALNLEVVAEGIETEAQWDFFKAEGCLYGQGYLFGRPMPQADFEARFSGDPLERQAAEA